MKEIYTFHKGAMIRVPEDHELKQLIKFLLTFVFGIIFGQVWSL